MINKIMCILGLVILVSCNTQNIQTEGLTSFTSTKRVLLGSPEFNKVTSTISFNSDSSIKFAFIESEDTTVCEVDFTLTEDEIFNLKNLISKITYKNKTCIDCPQSEAYASVSFYAGSELITSIQTISNYSEEKTNIIESGWTEVSNKMTSILEEVEEMTDCPENWEKYI